MLFEPHRSLNTPKDRVRVGVGVRVDIRVSVGVSVKGTVPARTGHGKYENIDREML